MGYSAQDRQRIMLKAKRNLKRDMEDYQDFMDQCVSDLEDAGVDDAQGTCEAVWQDQGGD